MTSTPTAQASAPRPQEKIDQPEEQPAEESYTERLLKAKRRVWDDRNRGEK